ncbi:catalase [Acidovorax sp.]|uniref:catalase n=1 Tax=Acidovorax sp. TaxID=1872122 RepID=UPI002626DE07|nr:catalase [Acidovorax sp.]
MDISHAPSTDWKEVVAPDEAQRFAGYARQFAELQARKSQIYGKGRALHRKQLTAARGQLQVLKGLPAFAAHGLFARPGQHDVLVRLSNGGMDDAPDRKPDIRGFSFSVLGVQGDSALGNGPAKSQDFALINQEKFAFPQSAEFVDFVVAASHGSGALLKLLVQRHGVVGALKQIGKAAKTFSRPFGGFAAYAMHSAAPIACGPYAVRVRLAPHASNGAPVAQAQDDWGAEFSGRLRQNDLQWDLQLQPFVDEATTPIEDASVDWPTPYTTVARLTLPVQDTAADPALAARVEAAVFDPWQALAAHRPLGDVMRARKVVYFESQQGRGAA